ARPQGRERLLRVRSESCRLPRPGCRASRSDRLGRGWARAGRRAPRAPCAWSIEHRGRLGRADRAVRTPRRPGQQRALRLSPVVVVNLLPQPRFADLSDRVTANPAVSDRVDRSVPPEGYELRIGADGVELAAADDAGSFYGRATLAQLARLHDGRLPV